MEESIFVSNKEYKIIKLIGHGKGGYSYLSISDNGSCVVKKIHHEPCDYYRFGNKIEAELHDYQRLLNIGIAIPKMIDSDIEKEIIVKEYIEGETIVELLKKNIDVEKYILIVKEMAKLAKEAGINIDYFPTNFVASGDKLYYVDYECNEYSDEWSFDNWGIKYWRKSKELSEYLKGLEGE